MIPDSFESRDGMFALQVSKAELSDEFQLIFLMHYCSSFLSTGLCG